MHWGSKNFLSVTEDQTEKAAEAANAGADYIVGSNPHLVQLYDVIKTDDGRKVPCFYSIGNYQAVMNQVKGNRDSLVVRIRLKRDEAGKVILEENNYIPCFCYRNADGCNWEPVSVSDNYNQGVTKDRQKWIYKRIVKRTGKKIKPL